MPTQNTPTNEDSYLGLWLTLITLACWATLPVVLKYALKEVDPFTLTWVRFLVAFLITAAIQLPRGALNAYKKLSKRGWVQLGAAGIFLVSNYILYLLGLNNTTPGNAQVLIQLAPLLMTMGGLFLFGERFNRIQWGGFVTLVGGILLFSSSKLGGLSNAAYLLGSFQIAVAACVWAAYALFQKVLLRELSAQQVMLFIYLVGTVTLFPLADPSVLLALSLPGFLAVAYASLNTLGAYGAFAEALHHWPASRISTVLALTPMATFLTVAIAHHFIPTAVPAEPMTRLAWGGAILAIVGSGVISLQKQAPAQK